MGHKEKLEDTKGVNRNSKSKEDRQFKDQNKQDKNNNDDDLHNTMQITKNRAAWQKVKQLSTKHFTGNKDRAT